MGLQTVGRLLQELSSNGKRRFRRQPGSSFSKAPHAFVGPVRARSKSVCSCALSGGPSGEGSLPEFTRLERSAIYSRWLLPERGENYY